MNSPSETLRAEIAQHLYECGADFPKSYAFIVADQILALARDKMPKKVKEYPNDGQAQYGQRVGYNRAIDTVKQILGEK